MVKFLKDYFHSWGKLPFKFKMCFILSLIGALLFFFGVILILLTGFRIYPVNHWIAGISLLSGVTLVGVSVDILIRQIFGRQA